MFTNAFSHRRPALTSSLVSSLTALLVAAAAAPAAAQTAPAAAASAPAGPVLRPEVRKALVAAQDALKGKDAAAGKEALARVAEAEAQPNLTPEEAYNTVRIKAVAAFTAGDMPLALSSFDTALASPLLPAADRLPITEVATKISLQLTDNARSLRLLQAYRELGGSDAALRRRLATLLVEQNDPAGALKEAQQLVQADEAAGRPPTEVMLKVMAVSNNKLKDTAGYNAALEKLTQYYGTLDYWAELIARTTRKPGFAEDRLRLDAYRLQRAVGLTLEGDEQADMAQRALLAGLPGEAQKLMDEGYVAGLFGKGKDAAAHQKLREQATKAAAADQKQLAEGEAAARSAKDGNALVSLGLAVAGTGATERGLGLVEQGIAKGGLRRADEAQLRLGMLQARLGRNDDALKTLAAVQGNDGTADLARLWSIHLRSAGKK
ncbi:hypothetical protein [Aquabacterium sp.]|uniref:hypothetical protein n=1 Tax=Aquabacterium sp. TaxID=1872578 RepID=UPI002B8CFDF3|nr:hypothetical protein [Aquabacterium sp.]HSW02991.1 hypothetical protein [Aquabacterium sp.]